MKEKEDKKSVKLRVHMEKETHGNYKLHSWTGNVEVLNTFKHNHLIDAHEFICS